MKNFTKMLICMSVLFSSCKKEEGEGGNSSIQGKVWIRNYNSSFSALNREYPGADVDVYIIYGDEITIGDRIKSNYDGMFEFKYLKRGNYKIYVYSDDSTLTSPSGLITIIKPVEITKKKQKVDIGTITILE